VKNKKKKKKKKRYLIIRVFQGTETFSYSKPMGLKIGSPYLIMSRPRTLFNAKCTGWKTWLSIMYLR
jgi:hypothetical protein